MEEYYHAFYSRKAETNNYRDCAFYSKIIPKVITNIYKLKNSDKFVESTAVFSFEKYSDFKDCPYDFEDKEYLGIVDKWIKVGKCI